MAPKISNSATARSLPTSFVLALAAVTALGPLSTDLYLASLPAIGAEFSTPAWLTQMTLTGYLLVLGLSQLIAGPLTDANGRRRLLLLGLALFTGSSVMAMLAPGIGVLVAARLIQGTGAGLAFVVANSTVRDRTKGAESVTLFAYLMTVSAAAPILAPALGGFLDQFLGWRAVFGALAISGVAVFLVSWIWLPESLPPANRSSLSLRRAMAGYAGTLTDRTFLRPLGGLCLAFVFLFAYIGGSSYVYQEHFGLTPVEFGLVFGATGFAVLLGAQVSGRMVRRFSARTVAVTGAVILAAGPLLALVSVLAADSLWGLVIGMALAMTGLGICEPALMAIAMETRVSGIGIAAALIGAAQFVLGAGATAAVAFTTTQGPLPWVAIMAAAGLGVLAFGARGRRPSPVTSAGDPALLEESQ